MSLSLTPCSLPYSQRPSHSGRSAQTASGAQAHLGCSQGPGESGTQTVTPESPPLVVATPAQTSRYLHSPKVAQEIVGPSRCLSGSSRLLGAGRACPVTQLPVRLEHRSSVTVRHRNVREAAGGSPKVWLRQHLTLVSCSWPGQRARAALPTRRTSSPPPPAPPALPHQHARLPGGKGEWEGTTAGSPTWHSPGTRWSGHPIGGETGCLI